MLTYLVIPLQMECLLEQMTGVISHGHQQMQQKLDQSKYRDGIRRYQYKTKNPSYNVDNWTNRYGHSFRMNAVETNAN